MWLYFFQILAKGTQVRCFWYPTQTVFVLRENLHFYKCENADFKYDNSFLKFGSNCTLRQIRACYFQV